MNKLLWCGLFGTMGFLAAGCGKPAQPVAVTPTSATPSGVIALPTEPAQTGQVKPGGGPGENRWAGAGRLGATGVRGWPGVYWTNPSIVT